MASATGEGAVGRERGRAGGWTGRDLEGDWGRGSRERERGGRRQRA